MVSTHWTRNFKVSTDDIDYLIGLLLEREIPLTTEDLAHALIERRISDERKKVEAEFKNTVLYNPAGHFEPGQKLVFPAMSFSTATVMGVRPGFNPQYGDFSVIEVEFGEADGGKANGGSAVKRREFAADYAPTHKLNMENDQEIVLPGVTELSIAEILEANGEDILLEVESKLVDSPSLAYVGQKWFPHDLMLEVDEGHLNLAEAVLDIMGGGPLRTEEVLREMGGLGDAPVELQIFSMNYALNEDRRFDEVGPAGEVLWFLTRLEPDDVKQIPQMLRYAAVPYDRSLLTTDMLALEREIGDELTEAEALENADGENIDNERVEGLDQATITLIYPHRRSGTLPLNEVMRRVFPTARRAPRIYVTLVDGQDGEEFPGWVVHRDGYVSGLTNFYRKHKIPIGGFVTAQRNASPGKITVNFDAYRPRSEYVPLMGIKGDQVYLENIKRHIGADYDDLMVIGVDDLAALETFSSNLQQQRKTLAAVLKMVLPALGNLTPQGTVHAKTLYSALNALRRYPPGPMLATLNANPDFENVGGHYWRLSEA